MPKVDRITAHPLRARFLRFCTLSDLGITTRLAIAFASVAVLAAASNFIVESGATLVERVISKEAPAPRAASPPVRAQVIVPVSQQPRVTVSQVVLALGNYDKAVRRHAESRTKKSAVSYAAAGAALDTTAVAFAQQRPQLTGDTELALMPAIKAHQRKAEAFIEAARQQRTLFANYSMIFARMQARLQASLDGAWKIMGRVVARQSLLKLNAQLDDLRSRFAMRNERSFGGAPSLVSAEQAFLATLKENESVLIRSQGEDWFRGMSGDAIQLTTTRTSLAQVETSNGALSNTFSRDTEQLVETLSRIAENAAPSDVAVRPSAMPVAAVEAMTSVDAPSAVSAEPARTTRRTIVAWVSVIVLAVVAYICIATILSVVRPVRRLLAATTRLANGQIATHITPGGIRELDTLSSAFNDMAEQIATAQAETLEAMQSLETRIEERTSQLQELAERDPLTGLANRRQLFVSLNNSIERAAADGNRIGAFFLDIDNFKTLNDSMGHAYGDRVLIAIAHRLEMTARSFGFAARLGGDEFMIVHEGAESIGDIVASGTRILEAFQQPIKVEGRELIVSVSVGASVYPDHEQDAEALMRAADAALFNAKELGRTRLTLFTPELLVRASAKFAIEQNLRRAIEKNEFELFYQPEVSVRNFEVTLVEALIRWRMPDGSYRTPGEFLAVAEESGLIMEVNDWVLRTAIEAASRWHRGAWPKVRMAINVSPRQFLDYRFVERLQGLLDEFKLPAQCLELELTESVLQTGPTTIKALAQLRKLGVAIALDDFGTGYSSMASLEQLPLTRIKLDRSLIARMDSSPRSASIARATIGLCSELGLEVTAEGVERVEQFTALLGYKSMSLQGYLVAHPVPADAVIALLKRAPSHCQELLLMSRGGVDSWDEDSRAAPADQSARAG